LGVLPGENPSARRNRGSRPVTAARSLAAYAGRPGLLVHKLLRAARRRRVEATYRERLAAGRYVPAFRRADDVRFTVAMPVYRVAETHLCAAIASVRAQRHENWRLLILDDASPDAHVGRVLVEAARTDARIEVIRRDVNAGIAAASNELLAAARTEFVAFLDHDDEVHPDALAALADLLAARPDADWIYTDEDKLDGRGAHYGPLFKPGFSRLYLLAFNLVSHLRVVRRAAAEHAGGHRAGFEGAQDYDLALRMLADGARFLHLPGVFYHWRAAAGSMAAGAAAKPAANRAAVSALTDYLARTAPGVEAAFEPVLGPASIFGFRLSTTTARPSVERLEPPLGPAGVTGDKGLWERIVARAHRSHARFIGAAPRGADSTRLDALATLLALPGVALVSGRAVSRRRVACSGWVTGDDGAWHDPWAGLAEEDPGYLNLALVPCPRHVPPPTGWVARRADLVAAWDAGPPGPGDTRVAGGLARLGLDAVADPSVSFRGATAASARPHGPVPAGLNCAWRAWADDLGLLP
jgi:Glycosyl transferase family 2